MRYNIFISSVLSFTCLVSSQSSIIPAATTATTPDIWGSFETSTAQASDPSDNSGNSVEDNNAAGASGSDTGSFGSLSPGGLIAIIVVVSVVVIFGITSSVLFYLAKKHDWQVRASIRKSARRVATALTPRTSEFPRSVKNMRRSRGRTRLEDIPPTPRLTSFDVEKANAKLSSFEMKEPKPSSKWAQKFGR